MSDKKRQKIPSIVVWIAWCLWIIASLVMGAFLTSELFHMLMRAGWISGLHAPSYVLLEYLVAYALSMLIAVGIPLYGWRMAISKQEFGVARSLRWTDLSWGLIGMVMYVALAQLALNIIVALVPTFNVTEAQDVGFTVVFGWERMLAFTVLVIVAPVVEELLFRGFLYGRLRKLHAPVWLSVLFVSAVFGFVHGQWNLAVDVFILGVVAALLREKTGTIWTGVVIHMMKNAVAFYLVFVMMMGR